MKIIYLVMMCLFLTLQLALQTGCLSKTSPADNLFTQKQSDEQLPTPTPVVIEVPVPVDLQITLSEPVQNNKKVGFQTVIRGGCNQPGKLIQVEGAATGFSVCQINQSWEALIDFSQTPVGSAEIEVYLVSGEERSAAARKTFIKDNTHCDSAEDRSKVFANFTSGGNGTSTPWTICTAAQFGQIRNYLSHKFIISSDIDFQNAPVSPIPAGFSGEVDGNEFEIKNIVISESSATDVGLFRSVTGNPVFRDLTISSISVTGLSVVGGLIGRLSAGTLTLANVHLTGTVRATSDYVGGVIAYLNSGTTINATVISTDVNISGRSFGGGFLGSTHAGTAAVSISDVTTAGEVNMSASHGGGVIGQIIMTSANLDQLESTSDVFCNSGTADNYLGGIIGLMSGGTLNGCESHSSVQGSGSYIGGVVGSFLGTSLTDCRRTGELRGDSSSRAISYVGGIAGNIGNAQAEISDIDIEVNVRVEGLNTGLYFGGAVGRFLGKTIERLELHGDLALATSGVLYVEQGDGVTTGASQVGGAFGSLLIGTGVQLEVQDSNADVDVTNLTANQNSYTGGFVGHLEHSDVNTTISSSFEDVTSSGNVISNNRAIGGFAGRIYATRASSFNQMTRVSARGNVTASSKGGTYSPYYIGGFSGLISTYSNGSFNTAAASGGNTLVDCSASGNVVVTSSAIAVDSIGGFTGYIASNQIQGSGSTSYLQGVSASGSVEVNVTGQVGNNVGGLIGQVVINSNSRLFIEKSSTRSSHSLGNVIAPESSAVGGLIGYVNLSGSRFELTEAYSNSSVSAKNQVGGIIGNINSSAASAVTNINEVFHFDSNSLTVDPTVTASGNSAGGFIGYAASTATTFLISNSGSRSSVTASSSYAGGFIGQDRDNVDISGSFAEGHVVGVAPYVGGLTGGSDRNGRDIFNTYATGNVIATVLTANETAYVGGLVGRIQSGSVTDSFATGDVSVTTAGIGSFANAYVGGLLGSSIANVSQAYALGNVTVTGANGSGVKSRVGGLIGNSATGSIQNSFALGNVEGDTSVGGLVGLNRSVISNSFSAGRVSGIHHVGGFVGDHATGSITSSYAVGNLIRISGAQTTRFGQLIGYCNAAANTIVVNSYYNSQTSIIDASVTSPETNCNSLTAARAKTSVQLKNSSSLVGFDFVGTNNSSWRFKTTLFKKGIATPYEFPVLNWF